MYQPDPKAKRIALSRTSKAWRDLVQEVFIRDQYICRQCLKAFNRFTLAPHHVKTVGSGGDDTAENLISVCQECHMKIHNGNIRKEKS